MDRELDDIDVRAQEGNDSREHPNTEIEFATFCEGEYSESIYVSRKRAREIYKELGELLDE